MSEFLLLLFFMRGFLSGMHCARNIHIR